MTEQDAEQVQLLLDGCDGGRTCYDKTTQGSWREQRGAMYVVSGERGAGGLAEGGSRGPGRGRCAGGLAGGGCQGQAEGRGRGPGAEHSPSVSVTDDLGLGSCVI